MKGTQQLSISSMTGPCEQLQSGWLLLIQCKWELLHVIGQLRHGSSYTWPTISQSICKIIMTLSYNLLNTCTKMDKPIRWYNYMSKVSGYWMTWWTCTLIIIKHIFSLFHNVSDRRSTYIMDNFNWITILKKLW